MYGCFKNECMVALKMYSFIILIYIKNIFFIKKNNFFIFIYFFIATKYLKKLYIATLELYIGFFYKNISSLVHRELDTAPTDFLPYFN